MAAQTEPIELEAGPRAVQKIEEAISISGKAEVRIGSHLYEVHRRNEKPPIKEAKSNVKQFLAAAKELGESLGDDVDWDQVRRHIEEERAYERANPRPIPNFD